MRSLMVLALALPATALAGGPMLTISGACPGPMAVEASGFTPGGMVAVLKGAGPGADVMPAGPCVGGATSLAGLAYVTSVRADGAGNVSVTPDIGAPLCGQLVQMVDASTCALSNPAPLGGGGMLYAGASRGGTTGFWSIDPSSGAVTYIGDPGMSLTGLTFASDGTLYGITGGSIDSSDVVTVDPATGAAAMFSATALSGEVAIADHMGTLYTIDQYSTFGTVDMADGTYVELGYPVGGAEDGYGYALASTPSGLFYVNGANAHVIDPMAGTMTYVGATGIGGATSGIGGGLAWLDGNLWFAIGNGAGGTDLYAIDTATGAASFTGITIPDDTIDSLAAG
ncbi:MAG: hypothetical protein ACI8PZ_003088 [Myxococcota bacterium]|jgi:hypothetical protein